MQHLSILPLPNLPGYTKMVFVYPGSTCQGIFFPIFILRLSTKTITENIVLKGRQLIFISFNL